MAQKKASAASQFKNRKANLEKGELIELEDGIKVLVKRPYVTHLVQQGIIPGALAAAQLRAQAVAGSDKEVSDTDAARLLKLRHLVVQLSVVDPVVLPAGQTPDYDAGQISISDLSESDIILIYAYVNGGLQALEMFRSAGEGVSTGSASEEVPGQKAE